MPITITPPGVQLPLKSILIYFEDQGFKVTQKKRKNLPLIGQVSHLRLAVLEFRLREATREEWDEIAQIPLDETWREKA